MVGPPPAGAPGNRGSVAEQRLPYVAGVPVGHQLRNLMIAFDVEIYL